MISCTSQQRPFVVAVRGLINHTCMHLLVWPAYKLTPTFLLSKFGEKFLSSMWVYTVSKCNIGLLSTTKSLGSPRCGLGDDRGMWLCNNLLATLASPVRGEKGWPGRTWKNCLKTCCVRCQFAYKYYIHHKLCVVNLLQNMWLT